MKNKYNFVEIMNKTDESADLFFYGDIVSSWSGDWDNVDQYPESIRIFLDEVKDKNLDIYVNSGGGNLFAGMAIYQMLKRHKGFKTVYIDGVAASIASVIAFAGDRVIIPSNGYIYVHKPWLEKVGNAHDMRQCADDLDVLEKGMMTVYESHLKEGVSIEIMQNMVDEGKWLSGVDAAEFFDVELGLENEVVACISKELQGNSKIPNSIKIVQEKVNDDAREKALAQLNLLCLV